MASDDFAKARDAAARALANGYGQGPPGGSSAVPPPGGAPMPQPPELRQVPLPGGLPMPPPPEMRGQQRPRTSGVRTAVRKTGHVLGAVLSAANKALSVVEFFSEMVAAKGPLTRTVQPTPYQSQQQGAHGSHELGHYAPEADPTSPYAVGHPHGAGFAHGPQTGHTYMPGPGR